MNSIDKEIEEFKNNLVTVDEISKELDNNNSKLTSVLSATLEIEELKKGLADEINNLKDVNEENLKKIEKSNDVVNKAYNQIAKSLTEMKDNTEVTLNSITKVETEFEDLKNCINNKMNIIMYLIIFNIILVLLVLGLIII